MVRIRVAYSVRSNCRWRILKIQADLIECWVHCPRAGAADADCAAALTRKSSSAVGCSRSLTPPLAPSHAVAWFVTCCSICVMANEFAPADGSPHPQPGRVHWHPSLRHYCRERRSANVRVITLQAIIYSGVLGVLFNPSLPDINQIGLIEMFFTQNLIASTGCKMIFVSRHIAVIKAD